MSHYLLPFELDRRQHPVSDMLTLRIVKHLDVIEHVLPCLVPYFMCDADAFTLQRVEESLDHRLVVAISPAAHGMFKSFQACRINSACEASSEDRWLGRALYQA